jgi:uncharacterized membrane protein
MALVTAAALLGARINIPFARLLAEVRKMSGLVKVFGVTYRLPLVIHSGGAAVAVNACCCAHS